MPLKSVLKAKTAHTHGLKVSGCAILLYMLYCNIFKCLVCLAAT